MAAGPSECRARFDYSTALTVPPELTRRLVKSRREVALLVELEVAGAQLDALYSAFEDETIAGGLVLQSLASVALLPPAEARTASPLVPLLGSAMAESRGRLGELAKRIAAVRAGLQPRLGPLAEAAEQAAGLAEELLGSGCEAVAADKRALAGLYLHLLRAAAALAAGGFPAAPGLHWRACCPLADGSLSDEASLARWWEARARDLCPSFAEPAPAAPAPAPAPPTPKRTRPPSPPLPDHQPSGSGSWRRSSAEGDSETTDEGAAAARRPKRERPSAAPSPGRQAGNNRSGSDSGGSAGSPPNEPAFASASM